MPSERVPDRALERKRAVSTAALTIGLSIGVGLLAGGVTPWVAPAVTLSCLTLAVGQRTSWPFAIAAGFIVEAALVALIVRFLPPLGVGLVAGAAVIFGLVGAVALIVFATSRELRLPSKRSLRIGGPFVAAPLLLVAIVGVEAVGTANLEWAMHNDAVWNLVTTRLMMEDGGLDDIARPNASPLTPGLLAIAAAVGRGAVAPENLLAHDASRFAIFWLLCSFSAGLLAALIGARSVHGGSPAARIAAAAITGIIPFTWFTFGFATQYGFYNSTLTFVLLLAAWLAWLETRVAPIAGASVLSLAAVALLATWAPLAIVPFALAAFALLSRLPSLVRHGSGWRAWSVLALAAVPVPAYVVAFTLPDLRRDGAALAVDGGIMGIQPLHVVIIAGVTVAVAALNSIHRNQVHVLNGVVIVIVAGSIAAAYLLAQRDGAATGLWGYYPAKYGWILSSLLLVVLAAGLAGEMAGLRRRPFPATGFAAVALSLPLALMMLVPPLSSLLTTTLTPVAIATNTGVASGAPAAQRLFELAYPGRKTIVVSYLAPDQDRFLNSWLLQLESTSAQEAIRTFSYVLSPGDVPQACDAVRAWGGSVRVVTSDPSIPARFSETCPGVDASVEVRPA